MASSSTGNLAIRLLGVRDLQLPNDKRIPNNSKLVGVRCKASLLNAHTTSVVRTGKYALHEAPDRHVFSCRFGDNEEHFWSQVEKADLTGTEVLNVRLKTCRLDSDDDASSMGSVHEDGERKRTSRRGLAISSFKHLLHLKSSSVVLGEISIRALETASLGSRDNMAWYPVKQVGPDGVMRVVGEVELAIFWASKSLDHLEPSPLDVPTISTAARKALNKPSSINSVLKRLSKPRSEVAASRRFSQALSPNDKQVIKDDKWSETSAASFWSTDKQQDFQIRNLTIKVICAENLRALDYGNTSDPYCIVSCGGKKFKTKVQKRTLAPVWNETFECSPSVGMTDDDQVEFLVMDWDIATSDDDLGLLVLPLWKLLFDDIASGDNNQKHAAAASLVPSTCEQGHDRVTKRSWFFLHPTLKEESKGAPFQEYSYGKIHLEISFDIPRKLSSMYEFTPPGAEVANNPVSSPHGGDLSPNSGTSSPLRGEKSSKATHISTTLSLNHLSSMKPTLRIRIIQARNLAPMDSNGKSDPYCVVKCMSETKKTPVIKKALNPVWNSTFEFGRNDFISENETITILIKDKDFGFKDLADDDIGSVSLPIWSILNDGECMNHPAWYAIDSNTPLSTGEIQIMVQYEDPRHTLQRQRGDIYKGKVWLYELQVTVLSARNLVAADRNSRSSDPYCVLRCGPTKWKTRRARKTVNPVWNQKFKFRSSSGMTRPGLGRNDRLTLELFDYDRGGKDDPLGSVAIDLSYIIDEMGYIDAQGKHFTKHFPLEYVEGMKLSLFDNSDPAHSVVKGLKSKLTNPFRNSTGMSTVPEPGPFQSKSPKGADGLAMNPSVSRQASDPETYSSSQSVTAKLLSQGSSFASMSVRNIGRTSLLGSPGSEDAADVLASTSINQPEYDNPTTNTRAMFGEIQLRLRLVPIGETRMMKKYKLLARVYKVNNLLAQHPRSLEPPRYVYAKLKVGLEVKESSVVPIYRVNHADYGSVVFNSLFIFDNEIDWLIEQTLLAIRNGTPQSASSTIRVSICNALDDCVLTSFHDTLPNILARMSDSSDMEDDGKTASMASCDAKPMPRRNKPKCLADIFDLDKLSLPQRKTWFHPIALRGSEFKDPATNAKFFDPVGDDRDDPTREEKNSTAMEARFRLIQVEEELIPTLGYIRIKLKSFKYFSHTFRHTLRVVFRYGARVVPMDAVVNTVNPKFDSDNLLLFSVTNMYTPLVVELWDRRPASNGFFSRTKESADGAAAGEADVIKEQKWGKLVASTHLSPYDLLELEAQLLYNDQRVLKPTVLPPIKLELMSVGATVATSNTQGAAADRPKIRGTIWLEARYTENFFGGVLTPNPNPALRPEKVTSYANFRHEMERTMSILQWFGVFGGHMSSVLNWEDPAATIAVMSIISMFCVLDVYAARPLLLPVIGLLIHVVNRHKRRFDGRYMQEFQDREDETDVTARLRIAVIQARELIPMDDYNNLADPHARISVKQSYRSTKPSQMLGWTRTVPASLNPDFIASRHGFGCKSSSSKMSRKRKHGAVNAQVIQWETRVSNKKTQLGGHQIPAFETSLAIRPVTNPLVVVTICEARNLPVTDATGSSDPYTVVKIIHSEDLEVGESKRTTVKTKTLNPKWDERLVFGEKKVIAKTDCVEITVKDDDLGLDDNLGKVTIQLTDLERIFSPNNGATTLKNGVYCPRQRIMKRWLDLEAVGDTTTTNPRGQVLVSINWVMYTEPVNKTPISPYASRRKQLPDISTAISSSPGSGGDLAVAAPKTPSVLTDRWETQDVNEEQFLIAPDSWKKSESEIVIDLYDQDEVKQQFMGRAVLPVASMIADEEVRTQPVLETWIPLAKRFDGSKSDRRLAAAAESVGRGDFGQVLIRAELVLPDPMAKEFAMEREEAKRADRAGPIQKWEMLRSKLGQAQNALYHFNNRAERMKNLFNWSHPRKTAFVMKMIMFVMFLFTLIPSRYIVLFLNIYLFTEHFRPLGTMKIKFMHLMALVPTDDDIREACHGSIVGAKTKIIETSAEREMEEHDKRRNGPPLSPTRQFKRQNSFSPNPRNHIPAARGASDSKGSITAKRSSIIATARGKVANTVTRQTLPKADLIISDAAMSGHMRIYASTSSLFGSSKKWQRRFFILSPFGMHWWNDREHAEEGPPVGSLGDLVSVAAMDWGDWKLLNSGCPSHELMLCLETENPKEPKVYMACTSMEKRDKWVDAIQANCFSALSPRSSGMFR